MTELLGACRARLAEIARLAEPTFASVVVPLEELRHRLARTWSPIGHLNGVMNSEALRAAYNACLPLLSEYYTDLSQSEPLYRAYLHIRTHEGARLDAVQLAVLERALHDFHQAGVALDGDRKLRFKGIMSELAQLQAKFEENVLDSTTPGRTTSPIRRSSRASMPASWHRPSAGRASRGSMAGSSVSISRPTSRWSRTRTRRSCAACFTKPGARALPIGAGARTFR